MGAWRIDQNGGMNTKLARCEQTKKNKKKKSPHYCYEIELKIFMIISNILKWIPFEHKLD